MKRISKNRIEFDCIIRMCSSIQTSVEDGDLVDAYIHYFDREDDINLVIRGKYTAPHLERLREASSKMEVIKIIIEVKEKDTND